MAYQVTRAEGNALHFLALALRPEWEPKTKDRKGPGAIWQEEILHSTFEHAENFDHCLAALINYCKAEAKGAKKFRYPRPFPNDGEHWASTRPAATHRPGAQPICQDHTAYNRDTCPICADEIAAKQRSPQQRGKRIRQVVPSPGILTKGPT